MHNVIVVRQAQNTDIGAIAEIYRDNFPASTKSVLGRDVCEYFFRTALDHPSYLILVATNGDKCLGFAMLNIDRFNVVGHRWLYRVWPNLLTYIFTHPLATLRSLFTAFNRRRRKQTALKDPQARERFQTSAYLDTIAVAAVARGRGVGMRLAEACLAQTHARSIPWLYLTVRRDNTQAIAFYKRMGFQPHASHAGQSSMVYRKAAIASLE